MSVTFAALMCHAPIVVPAVGGSRGAACTRTTTAMREIGHRAVASAPDRLVVLHPQHNRYQSLHWGAWAGPHRADLGRFRAPQAAIDLPDDPSVAQAVGARPIDARHDLDHGAMVPLWFLWDAGWRGPTAILCPPLAGASPEVGQILAGLPGRTALVASGDMSHRLEPGAPGGFHPSAADFDRAFVAALRADDWARALSAPHRRDAGEDVIETTSVAMAAVGQPLNAEVLCYEGPFGVGYTEAVLYDPDPALYAVARRAVRARVTGERYTPPLGGPTPAGAFVTLHKHGRLRGCIGHIQPLHDRLYDEIVEVAGLAATRDPRFPAVAEDELDELHYEVSVLEPPEPIAGPEQLDPRVYGAIVTAGRRRGLLLPDIEGVDTVEQQLSICRRKGGISDTEPVTLERFRVTAVAQP